MAITKTGFIGYIKRRIEKNKNFVAAFVGQTRSGKSYSAIKMAEDIDPDFTIDNIAFSSRQFLDLVRGQIKELKPGSVIIWDELEVSMSNLEFQSRQAKLLNYVLATFAKKRIILFITAPYFKMINNTARSLFHSLIETKGIDEKTKEVVLKPLLLQTNQDSGQIFKKYLRIIKQGQAIPLKRLRVPLPNVPLLKLYEAKKDAFMTKLYDDVHNEMKRVEDKEERKIKITDKQEEILAMLREGLHPVEIAKRQGITPPAIYGHMHAIQTKGIRIKAIKNKQFAEKYEVFS